MEKFPALQGILPSRVSRYEESIYDRTEQDIVSNLTEPADRNRVSYFLQTLIMINSIFVVKGTSGSFLQNLHRVRERVSGKLFALMIISCVIHADWLIERLEKLGMSRTTMDRLRSLTGLVSLLVGISGLHKEFDSRRQVISHRGPHIVEPNCQRVGSFEFLSRMIFIEALSKLSFVLFPLFDIRNVLLRLRRSVFPSFDSRESTVCCVCFNERLVFPFTALPCRDVYCYYCYRTKEQTEVCSKCNDHILDWSPFIS